jgi:hypothetical protein
MIYKERSPNIKGNALHEENTSFMTLYQGSYRFPFLTVLCAEFNIYCVQCTLMCGRMEWKKTLCLELICGFQWIFTKGDG